MTDNPGLDVGIALPVTAVLQQVGLERRKTGDGRSAVAERAQTSIHAKHEAIRGAIIQQPDDNLRQASEILLATQLARSVAFPIRGIQEDDIDVGGEIQFAAAQLAHRQHDERHDITSRPAETAMAFLELPLAVAPRGREHPVRKCRQRGKRLVKLRNPRNLTPQDVQHEAMPEAAQARLRLVDTRRAAADVIGEGFESVQIRRR